MYSSNSSSSGTSSNVGCNIYIRSMGKWQTHFIYCVLYCRFYSSLDVEFTIFCYKRVAYSLLCVVVALLLRLRNGLMYHKSSVARILPLDLEQNKFDRPLKAIFITFFRTFIHFSFKHIFFDVLFLDVIIIIEKHIFELIKWKCLNKKIHVKWN